MTTKVTVEAHCDDKTEIQFGITTTKDSFDNPIEVVTLQDGESAEKLVYDNRIAIVQERRKLEIV